LNISSTHPGRYQSPRPLLNPEGPSQPSTRDLTRPDSWQLQRVEGTWSNKYDALTYRRTASNVGAAVGAFASHFAVIGLGAALGASVGAGLGAVGWGFGIAGAVGGGLAGGVAAAKIQGTTLWGRSVLSKAGATAGNVVGRALHALKIPIRSNHVETAERYSVKSLNRYGADLSHSGHDRISESEADDLVATMEPGDVVLTGDHRSTPFATATQLLTGRSDFTHAILYKGEGQAIEAVMGDGVREKSLKAILMGKNHAVALRPDYEEGQAEKAVEFSENLLGRSYDFKFKGGNENWYCSELVYGAVKESAPQIEFETRRILGKEIVVPNDLFYTDDAGVVGEVGEGRTYLDRLMGKFIAPREAG
jgi:uncharacterized protein YycO